MMSKICTFSLFNMLCFLVASPGVFTYMWHHEGHSNGSFTTVLFISRQEFLTSLRVWSGRSSFPFRRQTFSLDFFK